MIKTITKIGNSQGIILDNAIMELAHLKVGDTVNIEIHQGGTLTVVPVRAEPTQAEVDAVISKTMGDFAVTMKGLA